MLKIAAFATKNCNLLNCDFKDLKDFRTNIQQLKYPIQLSPVCSEDYPDVAVELKKNKNKFGQKQSFFHQIFPIWLER